MAEEIEIKIVKPDTPCGCMICPNCGAHEVANCGDEEKRTDVVFQIKPFKVDDKSHCLKCGAWF